MSGECWTSWEPVPHAIVEYVDVKGRKRATVVCWRCGKRLVVVNVPGTRRGSFYPRHQGAQAERAA